MASLAPMLDRPIKLRLSGNQLIFEDNCWQIESVDTSKWAKTVTEKDNTISELKEKIKEKDLELSNKDRVITTLNEACRRLTSHKEQDALLISELQDQNVRLKEKLEKAEIETNMLRFKSHVLVEMLAVRSLDEEQHRHRYEQEKKKARILTNEIRRLLSEQLSTRK